MKISTVKYLGSLRTEAVHLKSENKIITDAPTDNQGKGEAFSPTDLLSTSLASCMMTIMGIVIRNFNYPVMEINADVYKEMGTAPRKVEKIKIDVRIKHYGLDDVAKEKVETAGKTCPVALSLHPDLKQEISFIYES